MSCLSLKKIKYCFFPSYYPIVMTVAFLCTLILAILEIINHHMATFGIYVLMGIVICICPYFQSEFLIRKVTKMEKKLLNDQEVYFDVVLDREKVVAYNCSSPKSKKMMYHHIKKIIETKEMIVFISQARNIIFFEKKNIQDEDLKIVKTFFKQQNILWKRHSFYIFQ